MIIGIGGKMHSGKDTVASIINYIQYTGITTASYDGWYDTKEKLQYTEGLNRIIHFADKIKLMLSNLYNIPIAYFNDTNYKDNKLYCINNESFINNHNYIADTKSFLINIDMLENKTLNEVIKPDRLNYISLRTLMQYFGNNVMKKEFGDNIWVNSTIKDAQSMEKAGIIPIIADVRFKEEANAIHNASSTGYVIKVVRNSSAFSNHISENEDFTYDYIIENNGTLMLLFYKVLAMFQQLRDRI